MIINPATDPKIRAFKAQLQEWIASNRASASDRDLTNLYATSEMCYTASNFWADNISAIPFIPVDDKGNKLLAESKHPLARILYDPRFSEVMRRVTITDMFWGRNLLRKERNLFGTTSGLQWINPNLYGLDATNDEGLRGFLLYPGRYHITPQEYLPYKDAVYFHLFSFDDDFDGIAPVEVAFLNAGLEPEMAQTALATFRNMAIPAAIAQPKGDKVSTDHAKDKPALVSFLRRGIQGAFNAGRTLVVSTPWEWIQLQMPFKDLAMQDLRNAARESTAMAFNTSIEFFITGQTTYAELEGKIELWEQRRLVPKAKWYAARLTEDLCKEFPGYTIVADVSGILKEDDALKLETVRGKMDALLITVYDGQKEMNVSKPDMAFQDMYLVEGVPVPKQELFNLWKYKFNAQAQTAAPFPNDGQPNNRIGVGVPELPATSSYVPDGIFDEIKLAARKGEKFTAKELPATTALYIKTLAAYGIPSDKLISAAKAHYLGVFAAKAIQATRLDFENDFEDIVTAMRGSEVDRRQAGTLIRDLISTYVRKAYTDGLIDGGVGADEIDDEDRAEIQDLIKSQSGFVSNFTQEVLKGNGLSDALAANKPAQWFSKSVYPAYVSGLQSAAKNMLVEWVYNPAIEEHCGSCKELNGQIHRISAFTTRGLIPKSDKLECKGFNCGCAFIPATGKARGNLNAVPLATKHHHEHAESVA